MLAFKDTSTFVWCNVPGCKEKCIVLRDPENLKQNVSSGRIVRHLQRHHSLGLQDATDRAYDTMTNELRKREDETVSSSSSSSSTSSVTSYFPRVEHPVIQSLPLCCVKFIIRTKQSICIVEAPSFKDMLDSASHPKKLGPLINKATHNSHF